MEKRLQKVVQKGLPTPGGYPGGTHPRPPKNSDFTEKFKRSSGSVFDQKCPKWHFFQTPRTPKWTTFGPLLNGSGQNHPKVTQMSLEIQKRPKTEKKWKKTGSFSRPPVSQKPPKPCKKPFFDRGSGNLGPRPPFGPPSWPPSGQVLTNAPPKPSKYDHQISKH